MSPSENSFKNALSCLQMIQKKQWPLVTYFSKFKALADIMSGEGRRKLFLKASSEAKYSF